MRPLSACIRRASAFLLSDPTAAVLIAAVYVAAGIVFVLTDYTLNNEGLLTHYWASWARQDLLPVLFFQKVKPVLCVLYAPVSGASPRTTMIAHVLVAASAIPMLAATARALGQRLPNLAALAVGLSPLFFYGGPGGVSNVDGVVGIVLVLYLLCARRQTFAAGLVAGLLPWVRFELVIFSAVMALYALLTRAERRMLLGMALFPLVYVGTGAVYHGDALWIAHFPPSTPFDPGNPIYNNQLIGLRYLLEPAAALTPIAALAAGLHVGRLQRVERALLAYAVITLVAMNVLPILRIGNFGAGPRYLLHVIPALALLVSRSVEPWWEDGRPGLASLLVVALVAAWVATRQQDARAIPLLLVAYGIVLGAAWLRAGTFAIAAVTALVLVGPLLPLRTEIAHTAIAVYLDPMAGWLKAHPEQSARPIFTNAQLLAPFLERYLPGADVYYLAGADTARELVMLTNPRNGQRDRIARLCAVDLYGKTLLPPISPDDLPDDALLALRDDARLSLLLPPATWSPRLELLEETRDYQVARLRPIARPAKGP